VDRLRELPQADLRWKHRVTAARQEADRVVLQVETPDGAYALEAEWVIDASGIASAVRASLGIQTTSAQSEDRWCISDVRFRREMAPERWTWVSAAFNDGRAVWQHQMADGVWRIDYQMAPDATPEKISRPDIVEQRLRAHLGDDVDLELVWVGPWGYRTQLLDTFRAERVFFAGDAAHVFSPFGARGGNSGMQDAENIAWKLAAVLRKEAPEALLDSYDAERRPAAAFNIRTTERSARFLAPALPFEKALRAPCWTWRASMSSRSGWSTWAGCRPPTATPPHPSPPAMVRRCPTSRSDYRTGGTAPYRTCCAAKEPSAC